MWKVYLIGVIAVILAMLLRRNRGEFAILVVISAGIIILGFTLDKLGETLGFITELVEIIPIDNSYFIILLKMLGISYAGEFTSGICQDAGYGSIAVLISLFTKIMIVTMSVPALMYFLETMEELL